MIGQAILGEAVLKESQTSEAGKAETVEALVAQFLPMVFRICWSILRNHHDAEDAVQECFLRVLKFRNRMNQIRNPKTWLARVAWTTALDRRSGRAVVTGTHSAEALLGDEVLEQLASSQVSAEQELANRQMQELLEKLIAGLPEELRQPLELSTVQELNSAEIAEIMNIPAESVRTRLMRARQILKTRLAGILEAKKHG